MCTLQVHHKSYRCSLGRSGVSQHKKEGDGATPVGIFPIRAIYYRSDRVSLPSWQPGLPIFELSPNDAWSDDPSTATYNQHLKLPASGSYENLYRYDHIYDIVLVVGYNDQPIIRGRGSAIFIHVARANYAATHGCIALSKGDLLAILPYINKKTLVKITLDGVVILTP